MIASLLRAYRLFVVGLLAGLPAMAQYNVAPDSAAWTYMDTVNTVGYSGKAWLFVPKSAGQVALPMRGFVFASHTVAEFGFVHDSALRAVCEAERLGIVYLYPSPITGFGSLNDTNYVNKVLDKLARVSGHTELRYAPWCPFGHSTGSAFVRYLTFLKPERTFGNITYKGGAIQRPREVEALRPGGNALNVPFLGVSGEFEEFGPNNGRIYRENYFSTRDSLAKLRAVGQANWVLDLMLPGEGHWAYTRAGALLIAEFVRKAAQARIPAGADASNGPVQLNALNDGAALDTNQVQDPSDPNATPPSLYNSPGQVPAGQAYYNTFDAQMAQNWQAFIAGSAGKRRSPVIFNGNGNLGRINVQANAGPSTLSTVSFSPGGRPFRILPLQGWANILGPTQAQIDPASLPEAPRYYFVVEMAADGQNKLAHQPFRVDAGLNTGQSQGLTLSGLPALVNLSQPNNDTLYYDATATSGLPFTARVVAGPARLVRGGKLVLNRQRAWRKDTAVVRVRFTNPGNGTYQTTNVDRVVQVVNTVVSARSRGTRQALLVSPNPATRSEELRVVLPEPATVPTELRILDLTGKTISRHFLSPGTRQAVLPSVNLKPGVYFLRVADQVGRFVVR